MCMLKERNRKNHKCEGKCKALNVKIKATTTKRF